RLGWIELGQAFQQVHDQVLLDVIHIVLRVARLADELPRLVMDEFECVIGQFTTLLLGLHLGPPVGREASRGCRQRQRPLAMEALQDCRLYGTHNASPSWPVSCQVNSLQLHVLGSPAPSSQAHTSSTVMRNGRPR